MVAQFNDLRAWNKALYPPLALYSLWTTCIKNAQGLVFPSGKFCVKKTQFFSWPSVRQQAFIETALGDPLV
jgi:hypothetical protein